ncbi:hypothetical protein PR048_005552 [Dryococelus australis]|uniref:Uncharacterized protein n=1 Tax=Dryococelus australis TaxID=614101 RepID=A0ABQ9I9F7_9NEOP|nr:hypothetical protein PR048_005552 [Dryococelus australis]
MERRRNEVSGETGDPLEDPPTNGIVRHDSHLRKSGMCVCCPPIVSLKYSHSDPSVVRLRWLALTLCPAVPQPCRRSISGLIIGSGPSRYPSYQVVRSFSQTVRPRYHLAAQANKANISLPGSEDSRWHKAAHGVPSISFNPRSCGCPKSCGCRGTHLEEPESHLAGEKLCVRLSTAFPESRISHHVLTLVHGSIPTTEARGRCLSNFIESVTLRYWKLAISCEPAVADFAWWLTCSRLLIVNPVSGVKQPVDAFIVIKTAMNGNYGIPVLYVLKTTHHLMAFKVGTKAPFVLVGEARAPRRNTPANSNPCHFCDRRSCECKPAGYRIHVACWKTVALDTYPPLPLLFSDEGMIRETGAKSYRGTLLQLVLQVSKRAQHLTIPTWRASCVKAGLIGDRPQSESVEIQGHRSTPELHSNQQVVPKEPVTGLLNETTILPICLSVTSGPTPGPSNAQTKPSLHVSPTELRPYPKAAPRLSGDGARTLSEPDSGGPNLRLTSIFLELVEFLLSPASFQLRNECSVFFVDAVSIQDGRPESGALVNMPECKDGGNRDTRENPPTSGIVRHDCHLRKSGRARIPGKLAAPTKTAGGSWILLSDAMSTAHFHGLDRERRLGMFELARSPRRPFFRLVARRCHDTHITNPRGLRETTFLHIETQKDLQV